MKDGQLLNELEKRISKSNAPSKTKPVEEPLFQNTGVKAIVNHERPAQSKLQKVGE